MPLLTIILICIGYLAVFFLGMVITRRAVKRRERLEVQATKLGYRSPPLPRSGLWANIDGKAVEVPQETRKGHEAGKSSGDKSFAPWDDWRGY